MKKLIKKTFPIQEDTIKALKQIKDMERRSVNVLVNMALEAFVNAYMKHRGK